MKCHQLELNQHGKYYSWKLYNSRKIKWNETSSQYYIQEKDKINIEMN